MDPYIVACFPSLGFLGQTQAASMSVRIQANSVNAEKSVPLSCLRDILPVRNLKEKVAQKNPAKSYKTNSFSVVEIVGLQADNIRLDVFLRRETPGGLDCGHRHLLQFVWVALHYNALQL